MPSLPPAAQRPPVLANERFQAHAANLIGHDTEEIFTYIYRTNLWGSPESGSGVGSELAATEVLRAEIPRLIRLYEVGSLLDLPCGDFGWLSHADLSGVDYTGADIVPDLVAENTKRYAGPGRRFVCLNLTRDPLPRADLVLCRDGLVHLSYGQIFRSFANLRRSGSTYLPPPRSWSWTRTPRSTPGTGARSTCACRRSRCRPRWRSSSRAAPRSPAPTRTRRWACGTWPTCRSGPGWCRERAQRRGAVRVEERSDGGGRCLGAPRSERTGVAVSERSGAAPSGWRSAATEEDGASVRRAASEPELP